MAAVKGTITSPGATGTQAISATNPKAIILWGTYTAQANGSEAADAFFGLGFGTYRSGAAQQHYNAQHDDDATAAGTYTTSSGTDALLRLITTAATVDAVVSLDSMSSSQVVLNWTDLPTTGSLILHYLILTDAEVSDAYVHPFTAGGADEDVTVVGGFGQPDAVLLAHPGVLRAAHGTGRTDLGVGIGAFTSDTARYATTLWGDDAAGTMDLASASGARAAYAYNGSGFKTFEMDPVARASWPTDGFRVTYPDANAGLLLGFLSLKLATGASVTVSNTSTLTAGSTQDLAHGAAPSAAFLFGGLDVDGTAVSGAETGGLWAGGWDGANEGGAGHLTDSGAANSQAGRWSRNDKALVVYRLPLSATTAPTTDAQADASVNGTNLRLTYTTLSSVARAFGYVIFTGAAGAGSNPLAGTITSASTITGALTVTAALAGTVAAASTVTGVLTARAACAGVIAATSTVTGSLTVTAPLAGTVAGVSTVTGTLTNAAPGSNPIAGTIAATSTVTGALSVAAPLAGVIASTSTVTGTLTATAAGTNPLVGTIAATSSMMGTLLVTKPLAGLVTATSTVTGSLTVTAGLRAVVAGTSTVSGAVVVSHPLAGQITGGSTVTGSIVVYRPLAGVIASVSTVSGTLTNQGPVTAVGRLEGGMTTTFSEGTGAVSAPESTSGVLALIE